MRCVFGCDADDRQHHYMRCPVLWRTAEAASNSVAALSVLERFALDPVMNEQHRLNRIRLAGTAATIYTTLILTASYREETCKAQRTGNWQYLQRI